MRKRENVFPCPHLSAHFSNTCSGWRWTEVNTESQETNPCHHHGWHIPQLLELSPLPPWVCINRKLDSGAEARGEPRHSCWATKSLRKKLSVSEDKRAYHKGGTPVTFKRQAADWVPVLSLLPVSLWPQTTEENIPSLNAIFAQVKQTSSSRNVSKTKSVEKITTHHDDTSQACTNWGTTTSHT